LTAYSNPDLADYHSAFLVGRKELIADAESYCDGLNSVAAVAESSKFERVEDRELCAALNIPQLNGAADDEHGATDVAGYYALIGQYIFLEVGAGFCYCEELADDSAARAKFNQIVNDYPEYD
jgi:hypothetical protein